MKNWEFYLLLSAVYLAPHATIMIGVVLGGLFLLCGLVSAIWGD